MRSIAVFLKYSSHISTGFLIFTLYNETFQCVASIGILFKWVSSGF